MSENEKLVAEQEKEVRKRLTESNMYTSLPVAAGLVFAELVFVLFISFSKSSQRVRLSQPEKIACFVYFCISFVFFLLSSFWRIYKNFNRRIAALSIYVFVISGFVFGTIISANEYSRGIPLYIFLLTTIFLPMMFYTKPKNAFFIFTLSYIALLGSILFGEPTRKISLVDVLMFVFAYVFSILFYIIRYKDKIHSVNEGIKLKELNESLQVISLGDALTGLKNRHALREDFASYLNKPVVVMMSDVDDFKFYNDTFGHDVGDKILADLAMSLANTFENKYCYRYGGDEFLVIYPNITEAEFKDKLEKWRLSQKSLVCNEACVKSSNSCGYIYGRAESQAELNRMLHFADEELYEAKHRGKNCAVGHSYMEALYDSKKKNNILMRQEDSKKDIDTLTGAKSMMYFINKAWLLIHNLMDLRREIGIIYFDVVDFKIFNERYGFTEGDNFLKSFAETLKLSFEDNSNSLISRFSDDHFVVLTYLSDIENKINRIALIIKSNWGKRIKAGIYKYNSVDDNERNDDGISLLCDYARLACQSIKNVPGELFRYYDEEFTKEHEKKVRIINKFDEVLQNREIKVFYQPIVDVKTRKITHFEALARWIDSEAKDGFLKPDEFIPVLEEHRRIYDMDLFVLEQIARDLHENLSKPGFKPYPISMNISWMDFVLTPMIDRIEKILKDYDIDKKYICFEIKEAAFNERTDVVKQKILLMKDSGFKVWLDNFGTGAFPLRQMDEYNLDLIKIDISFMQKFYTNSKIHSMLSNLVSGSKGMGVKCLAQGVENEGQFKSLKEAGFDKAQGYLFGQALPLDKAMKAYFK